MSEMSCPRCGGQHPPDTGACPAPSLTGRTLAGGIQVREKLGETPQGPLYRAEEARTGTEVELITLRPSPSWTMLPGDRGELDRLWDQFSRARGINHPNIASIKGMGMVPEGERYVVVEVLRGELLLEIIAARGALPLQEAAELILQAASGLQAAHQEGLLHGGLSPESILVTRTFDDRPLVKLIRFGSPPHSDFAAPEQLAGQRGDELSDIFSLGGVLHYLLTGGPPGAGIGSAWAIPEAARSVISKALEPLPEHRFRSVAAFARALAAARQEPVEEEGRDEGGGRRMVAIGAGIGIVAAGLWVAWSPKHEAGSEFQQGATVSMATPGPQTAAPAPKADTTPPVRSQRSRREAPVAVKEPAPGPAASTPGQSNRTVQPASPQGEGPGDSALGYAPDVAAEPSARSAPSLTDTPAMRLALSDVTRLDIVVDHEEVRPGRLVLVVGDGYRTSTSREYNLRQLYAAYVELLDYPGVPPVMELWRDGRKIGEYTREGLQAETEQSTPQ